MDWIAYNWLPLLLITFSVVFIAFPRFMWNHLVRFWPVEGMSTFQRRKEIAKISKQEVKGDPLLLLIPRMIFGGVLFMLLRDLIQNGWK